MKAFCIASVITPATDVFQTAPSSATVAAALFGTTFQGGNLGCQFNGCGAIFKLTPRAGGYTESIVYSFGGGIDGRLPLGSLISDGREDFFGTTQAAGGRSGYGTVFGLSSARASMTGYVLRTLYAFKGKLGDGNAPQGSVVADPLGNLYGTTAFGGASNRWGTVFRLSPDASGYHETILHSFSGGLDGSMPATALVLGPNGALFGTTPVGGSASGYQGNGVVFMLSPIAKGAYTYRTIHTFEGLEGYPGQLTLGGDGALYGTTRKGAGLSTGCVFRLKPTQLGFTYQIIYRFGALPDAEGAEGGVVFGPHGDLYGTSGGGGLKGDGTVFQLSLKRG